MLKRSIRLAAAGAALPSAAGSVARAGKRVLLGCSEGVLELLEVKPDGKRSMTAAEFAAGVQGKNPTWEAL